MKLNIWLLVMICSSLMLSGVSLAASMTIDQVTSDGNTITISGQGFGNQATILSWDDFEAGTPGTEIDGTSPPIGHTWDGYSSGDFNAPKFSDDRSVVGSQSSKHIFSDGSNSHWRSAFGWVGKGPYESVYVSYWRYADCSGPPCEDGSENHKTLYLFGSWINPGCSYPRDHPLYDCTPSECPQLLIGATRYGGVWSTLGTNGCTPGWGLDLLDVNFRPPYSDFHDENGYYYTQQDLNYRWDDTTGVWQRWEFYVELNDPYTASNAKRWFGHDMRHMYYSTSDQLRSIGDYVYEDFRIGHMDNSHDEYNHLYIYLDDLYLATGPQRIELGDNNYFWDCSQRDIQIPLSWTDTEIVFEKRGSGDYVFVVGADPVDISDGVMIDETCNNGDNRPCGSEIGMCEYGTQTCSGSAWGECVGGVDPTAESCTGEIDEDCDGLNNCDDPDCSENIICLIGPNCGDNVLHVGEQCDDGNTNPHDGCHECSFTVPSNGQVHWVDQNDGSCDNSSSGHSVPWCDLLVIDQHTFVPGDSVVVRAGDYNAYGRDRSGFSSSSAPYEDADVRLTENGDVGNPIVIMGYPGEQVILRNEMDLGFGPSWGYNVFGFIGSSNNVFQGFTIFGSILSRYGHNNTWRGNKLYGIGYREPWIGNNYAGLALSGSWYNIVQNNHFEGFRGEGTHNSNGLQFWGYSAIHPGGMNNLAENNRFVDNNAGIYDKDNSRDNVHRKNYFENNDVAMKVSSQQPGECWNVSVYQNLVVDCGDGVLAEYGPGNSIYNNVFIGSRGFRHAYPDKDFETSFYNNILLPDPSDELIHIAPNNPYPDPIENNLYFPFTQVVYGSTVLADTLSQWQGLGYDLLGMEVDPLFANDQYHLSAGSPALDAGRFGEDLGLYPDGDTSIAIGPTLDVESPSCDDGTCNGGETCESCPQDCGVCCGNGEINPGEDCDGSNLNGGDCTDFGFINPSGLSCFGDCTYNPGLCSDDPVVEVIVDDGDVGTSDDGHWIVGSLGGGYNDDYLFSSPEEDPGYWYEWSADLAAGSYEVFATWEPYYSRPTDVSYRISHSGGTASVGDVDQTQSVEWYSLGTYDFDGVATVRVISGTSTSDDGGTCADAIRFVSVDGSMTIQEMIDGYGSIYNLVHLVLFGATL